MRASGLWGYEHGHGHLDLASVWLCASFLNGSNHTCPWIVGYRKPVTVYFSREGLSQGR